MAFLDKAGLQTLTNKLVQGDAIKVASSRGNTVKNVIDNITRECSDMENPQTMTLEDETGHFMIGKGKDIDVSGDVEAGKMAFRLKGKTLQNCLNTDAPLQNSLSAPKIVYKAGKLHPLKNEVDYTIILFNVPKEVTAFYFKKPNAVRIENTSFVRRNNNILHKFKTNGDVTEGTDLSLHLYPSTPETQETLQRYNEVKVVILEGDWTDKEIPSFFTGIKSSFETEEDRKIVHTGKNLFNDKARPSKLAVFSGGYAFYEDQKFPIDEKTQYWIQYKLRPKRNRYCLVRCFDEKGKHIYTNYDRSLNETGQVLNIKNTAFFHPDTKQFSLAFRYTEARSEAELNNLLIECYVGDKKYGTGYAPYTKEEKVLELDEPLRGLPSGVCDEIMEDGRLIRRIKAKSYDGSPDEEWVAYNNEGNSTRGFYCRNSMLDYKYPSGGDSIRSTFCDRFIGDTSADNARTEGYLIWGNHFFIQIKLDKLRDNSVEAMRDWLSRNPVSCWYETKEPQIVSIEPIGFNTSQHSRMDISSNIAPITTYKVPLNRAAQIGNSIKTIQELKQRIELLEQAYDNHFLESQYKLSLLKLEHQIESEEI